MWKTVNFKITLANSSAATIINTFELIVQIWPKISTIITQNIHAHANLAQDCEAKQLWQLAAPSNSHDRVWWRTTTTPWITYQVFLVLTASLRTRRFLSSKAGRRPFMTESMWGTSRVIFSLDSHHRHCNALIRTFCVENNKFSNDFMISNGFMEINWQSVRTISLISNISV